MFSLPAALLILPVVLWLKCSQVDVRPNFAGKTVLLCGACTGVGEHITLELAKQGAKLFLVARSDKRYQTLFRLRDKFDVEDAAISQVEKLMVDARTESKLEYIREAALELGSPQVEVVNAFDFGNVSNAYQLVEKTVELFGQLDYLVLNHAEIPRGHISKVKHHQTPEFIDRTFRVNVFSYIEIAMRAMPYLEQSKGNIFVTSSLLGKISDAKFPVFSSTKHALNGYFYSFQQDLINTNSSVGLTVGSFGEIQTEELLRMFSKYYAWLTGNPSECAIGMLQSLATRAKTFSYPKLQTHIAHFLWFLLPN